MYACLVCKTSWRGKREVQVERGRESGEHQERERERRVALLRGRCAEHNMCAVLLLFQLRPMWSVQLNVLSSRHASKPNQNPQGPESAPPASAGRAAPPAMSPGAFVSLFQPS